MNTVQHLPDCRQRMASEFCNIDRAVSTGGTSPWCLTKLDHSLLLNWRKGWSVISEGHLQDLIDKFTALVDYLVLLCRTGRVSGLGLDRHQNMCPSSFTVRSREPGRRQTPAHPDMECKAWVLLDGTFSSSKTAFAITALHDLMMHWKCCVIINGVRTGAQQ